MRFPSTGLVSLVTCVLACPVLALPIDLQSAKSLSITTRSVPPQSLRLRHDTELDLYIRHLINAEPRRLIIDSEPRRLTFRDVVLAVLEEREQASDVSTTDSSGINSNGLVRPARRNKLRHSRRLRVKPLQSEPRLSTESNSSDSTRSTTPSIRARAVSKAAETAESSTTTATQTNSQDAVPRRRKTQITCRVTQEGVTRCFRNSLVKPNSITQLDAEGAVPLKVFG